jgi:uncharacterized Zn finger protein (UPF0148 family)
MFKKVCDHCSQPSYSSSETGKWLCPLCNHDITHVLLQDAESQEALKLRFEAFKSRYTFPLEHQETVNKYI